MKKTIRIFAVLAMTLMMAFAFAACGSSNPFVGKWKEDTDGTNAITLEIKDDNTAAAVYGEETMNATWKTDKDQKVLTVTFTEEDIEYAFELKDGKLKQINDGDIPEQYLLVFVKA